MDNGSNLDRLIAKSRAYFYLYIVLRKGYVYAIMNTAANALAVMSLMCVYIFIYYGRDSDDLLAEDAAHMGIPVYVILIGVPLVLRICYDIKRYTLFGILAGIMYMCAAHFFFYDWMHTPWLSLELLHVDPVALSTRKIFWYQHCVPILLRVFTTVVWVDLAHSVVHAAAVRFYERYADIFRRAQFLQTYASTQRAADEPSSGPANKSRKAKKRRRPKKPAVAAL